MGKTKPGCTSIKSTADKVKFVNVESPFINKQTKLLQMPVSKWKLKLLSMHEMVLRNQSIVAFTQRSQPGIWPFIIAFRCQSFPCLKIHYKPLNIF